MKLLTLLLFAATAPAQQHWVGTWSTAPVQTTNTGATVVLGAPAAPAPPPAIQPNAATPTPPSPATVPTRPAPPALGSTDITLRQIVHLSLGGNAVRVVFTNEYGTDPLSIGAASIETFWKAQTASTAALAPTQLAFGGKPQIVIPPGAIAVSDAINFPIIANQDAVDFVVNTFIPAQTITHVTRHTGALQTSYITQGNTTEIGLRQVISGTTASTPIYSWTFLKSVDVQTSTNAAAVVAFGDSITDGAYATRDQNARWPDDLARRLAQNPATANLAVLNEGIGGNRVLHDNTGPSALARFTRDALDQAGVKYIVLLEAINDIGHAYRTTPAPDDVVTAADLIQGYQQLIDRAHLHGIKVIGATLTPYGGAGYGSPAGDQVRMAVNQWIRTSGHFDGVVDFDKATQDPAHPDTFLPAFDHGDHLHPTDAGLSAMANAFDLTLFTK